MGVFPLPLWMFAVAGAFLGGLLGVLYAAWIHLGFDDGGGLDPIMVIGGVLGAVVGVAAGVVAGVRHRRDFPC